MKFLSKIITSIRTAPLSLPLIGIDQTWLAYFFFIRFQFIKFDRKNCIQRNAFALFYFDQTTLDVV